MALMKLFGLSLLITSALTFTPNAINITSINIGKALPQLTENFLKLEKTEQVAVLNDYIDILFKELNNYLLSNNVDPLPLPELIESFRWTIFHGEVSLKDGALSGISSLIRNTDVTVSYDYPILKLHLPLSFNEFSLRYNYLAQFMGFGPNGVMTGSVKGCIYTTDLSLDLTTLRTELSNFRLNTLGKLKLKFDGGMIEEFVNVFLSIITPLVTPVIRWVLDGFLEPALNSVVEVINGIVEQVLGLPSP